MSTKLSVCIPTVGRSDRIIEHFSNLEEIKHKIELVILSEPPYSRKLGQLSEAFPNYVYAVNNEASGYGYSIIKLTELATSDYILFSSDEDILQLENLRYILKIIENTGDFCSIVTNFGKCQSRTIWNFPDITDYRRICESETGSELMIKQPAALEIFYWSQKHLTGIIVKRNRIDQSILYEFINTNIDPYVSCILHSQVVTDGVVLYFNEKLFQSGRQAESNHQVKYGSVKSRSRNILIRLNRVIPKLTNDPSLKQKLMQQEYEWAALLFYHTLLYRNCKSNVKFLLKKKIILNKSFLYSLFKIPLRLLLSQSGKLINYKNIL